MIVEEEKFNKESPVNIKEKWVSYEACRTVAKRVIWIWLSAAKHLVIDVDVYTPANLNNKWPELLCSTSYNLLNFNTRDKELRFNASGLSQYFFCL